MMQLMGTVTDPVKRNAILKREEGIGRSWTCTRTHRITAPQGFSDD